MSSSSFAPDSVAALLAESFDRLAVVTPGCHEPMADLLGGTPVRLEIGDETVGVRADAGRVRVTDAAAAEHDSTIVITTDVDTVLDVIDGRCSLWSAVHRDRVEVVGSLTGIENVHDALLIYTHACVRSNGVKALLGRLRRTAGD